MYRKEQVKLETHYAAEEFKSLDEAEQWLNDEMNGRYHCKGGVKKYGDIYLAQLTWAEKDYNVIL